MKAYIITAGLWLLMLPALGTMWLLGEKGIRERDLKRALNCAAEQTMQTAYMVPYYDISSQDELLADIAGKLILRLRYEGDLTIRVYSCSFEEGFIDLEAEQIYEIPGGRESVTARCSYYLEKQ